MGLIPTGDREDVDGTLLCSIGNANPEDVLRVLAADPGLRDGFARSQWVWLRLPSGDLFLAIAPQDETYFATEKGHTA